MDQFVISAPAVETLKDITTVLYRAMGTPAFRRGEYLRDIAQTLERILDHLEPFETPHTQE